jgi:leukotriene-A4 hydrolase
VKDWSPQEWVRFLDQQPADLDDGKLAALQSTYRLGADGNAEIALSWFELVIRTAYEPAYAGLERFLLDTGRWRLVETLFRELSRTESGRALGERIYAKAKPGYHRSIRDAVERLLYPGRASDTAQ